MALKWHELTENFDDVLYAFIKKMEAPPAKGSETAAQRLLKVVIVDENPTIGVGFDLVTGGLVTRNEVMRALGLDSSLFNLTKAPVAGTPEAKEYAYIKELRNAFKKGTSASTFDGIMLRRSNEADAAYVKAYPNRRSTFSFSDEDSVRSTFEILWEQKYREQIYKKWPELIGDTKFSISKEILVLASLTYNGGTGLLGEKLHAAIQSDNRAEAWYEIRYGSNSEKQSESVKVGLAKRRYMEAQVFGLYDDKEGKSATPDEAKKIYKMLTGHREAIFKYEGEWYGTAPDGTQGQRKDAQGRLPLDAATSDYSTLLQYAQTAETQTIPTLKDALVPARKAFIEWLNTTLPSDKQFTASAIDAINPAAIYYGGDNVPVQVLDARADDARTGNDLNKNILVGGSGKDILIGGKNDDVLVGAAGLDTYIQTTGDGNDTLIDSDRKGRIIINKASDTNGDSNTAASLFLGVEGQANTWKSLDGALTLTHNGNWVLSFEGGSIDLGITLDEGNLGIRRVDALVDAQTNGQPIQGDLKPIDTDPAQQGDQFSTDEFGNLVVGAEEESGRADTLYDRPGNDHIISGGGNDVINVTRGGDNVIEAGSGRDWVYGGNGNDVVSGGSGADILQGGDGNDRLYAGDKITLAQAISLGNSQTGTNLKGDWLSGNDGDDIIVAGADNDVLSGGAGNDLLIGGAGNDDLFGDIDWMPTNLEWSGSLSASTLFYTPISGNAHPSGEGPKGPGADVIYAGAGNDRAWGGLGDDTLYGESGSDYLHGNGGQDILFGGSENDFLWGDAIELATDTEPSPGDDYLDGGSGNDYLNGGEGNDILIGGTGDDTLVGGKGQDVYLYNKGDGKDTIVDTKTDSITSGYSSNTLKFGEGIKAESIKLKLGSLMLDLGDGDQIHIENFDKNDAVESAAITSFEFADGTVLTTAQLLERGFDIDGTEGDDILTGTSVADRINGYGGNDYLYGGKGEDVLDGGNGMNLLMGAEGDDTYVVRSADVAVATVPEGQPQVLSTTIDDALGSNLIRLDVAEQPLSVIKLNEGYGLLWAVGQGQAGLHLQNMGTAGRASIEFSDGRTVSVRQIVGESLAQEQYAYSSAKGDVLVGGGLNDSLAASGQGSLLSGGRGDDFLGLDGLDQTVEYRRGDGQDTLGGSGRGAVIALQGAFDPGVIRLEVDEQGRLSLWLGVNQQTGEGERLFLNLDRNGLAQARLLDRISFDDGTEVTFTSLLEQGVLVQGTSQDDVLTGTDQRDTFVAGPGADWLAGGQGDDVYEVEASSSVTVDDAQGFNRILLKNANDWTAVTLSRPVADGNDLLLEINGEATVTLTNALLRSDKFVVTLADGSDRLLRELIQELAPQVIVGGWENDVIQAGPQGSLLDGGYGDDVLVGGAGDDWMLGGDGNDVLDGHGGNDALMGGDGDDSYVVRLAPGQQQLIDVVGNNRVRFGAGISASQIEVLRPDESTDVLIQIDANQSLLIRRGLEGAVERFEFEDGTVWTYGDLVNRFASPGGLAVTGDDDSNILNGSSGADLLIGQQGDDQLNGFSGDDELQGGDGNDVLVGGQGNDLLAGGDGLDTYVLNLGDGIDRIVDTQGNSNIRFGTGISLQDLSATRIQVNGIDYVRLQYSESDAVLIDSGTQLSAEDAVQFSNGNSVSWTALLLQVLQTETDQQAGPEGGYLYGTAAADILRGSSGRDYLIGGAGDDTLSGGLGDDTLDGGTGADTFVIHANGGHDTLLDDGAQTSTILLDQADTTGLSFSRIGHGLLVESSQLDASFYIPTFYTRGSWTLTLTDGSTHDLTTLAIQNNANLTTEQRRQGFYGALLAEGPVFDPIWSSVEVTRDGQKTLIDSEGNETVFSLTTQRVQIDADTSLITASADDLTISWESSFLRDEYRNRTYEVVDVTYQTSQALIPGNTYQMFVSPSVYGSTVDYSAYVPPGYTSYFDGQGNFFIKEPDYIGTIRTPVYTTRVVQEDYTISLWKHENNAVRTVEDVRAGENDNQIVLSGSASKLVDAGGGNDTVIRTQLRSSDQLGQSSVRSGDWVDGGVGNDSIRLGEGDDELSGGNGNDELDGGAGADVYHVSSDDDGWDLIYDRAVSTVHVEFVASYYGRLDAELESRLASLMVSPERTYTYNHPVWNPGAEPGIYGTGSLVGEVPATLENLQELLQISRSIPELEETQFGWLQWSTVFRSEGLDRLIAAVTGSAYQDYSGDNYGNVVIRPDVSFDVTALSQLQASVHDTVRFGSGVLPADLMLEWGVAALDDGAYQTLNISWGGQGGVRIVVPEIGITAGIGIERFEFSDGTRWSIDQMILQAPARPSFSGGVTATAEPVDLQLREDSSFELPLASTAFEITGSRPVRYSAMLADDGGVLPDWLQLDSQTGVLSGTPGNDAVGELRVEIRAIMSPTSWATQIVQLAIHNTNDAPAAESALDEQSIDAGQPWTWQIPEGVFTDADQGDRLHYRVTSADGSALPAWLTFDVISQRLMGTPGSADVGELQLRVTAIDLSGAQISTLLDIHVQAVAQQDLIGSEGSDQLNAGLLASNLYGLGDDDVLLGSAASDLLDGGQGNDVLAAGEGQDTYVFQLGDGNDIIQETGASLNTITFGAGVLVNSITMQRDGADLIVHYGTQGDTIRIASADGLTLPRNVIQHIELSDGTLLSMTQLINVAPIVGEALADQEIQAGTEFTYALPTGAFIDADGDNLSLSASLGNGDPLPDWLTFNTTNGNFSGIPPTDFSGSFAVAVQALDPYGAVAQQTFEIAIQTIEENSAPVAVADTVVLDEEASVTASGNVLINDIDQDSGDLLVISNPGTYQGLYGILVLNQDGSYVYSLEASNAAVRLLADGSTLSETFTYELSDGAATDQTDLTITIVGRNDQPEVIASVPNQSALAFNTFLYQIPEGTFADVDAGDSLSYAMTLASGEALPSWLQFDPTSRSLSGKPAQTDASTLQLRVTATDSQGASTSQTFQLVVSPLPESSGGASTDELNAQPSGSVLYGLGGDDFLNGNAGNDALYGGDGVDQLWGEAGDDVLDGGADQDFMGGGLGNDTLAGGDGNDFLWGDEGDDTLYGQDGEDAMEGNDGNDHLEGGAGSDGMHGNLGNDLLLGGLGDDLLYGDEGDDILLGQEGAEYIEGGDGNDVLDGGTGNDVMFGGAGNDVYHVDTASDYLYEESNNGTDTVVSMVSHTLGANFENLTLAGTVAINGTGNSLANSLIGNDAVNTLSAGGGADTLDGRGGNDTLTGGAGNDTYLFGLGYGSDTVIENDSTAGNTDIAQFLAGIDSDQIWFRQVGNHLEASVIGTGDKLMIQNWYSGSSYRIEQFKTADGMTLLESNVQNLVQAMAGFSPPAAGQTSLPANYESNLQPVIAANWQ